MVIECFQRLSVIPLSNLVVRLTQNDSNLLIFWINARMLGVDVFQR
jgi:hypothetical protein